jgi:thymidylate synthase
MPLPPQVECWPSEIVGWLVRGDTIVEAWLQVVRNIMRYGVEKGTQYGMRQKECVGFSWAIDHEEPLGFRIPSGWPAELAALTGSSPEKIEGYLPTILEANGDQEMYGTRLRAYPLSDGRTLDQVMDVLVRNFRESPDSRRAVATTMIPSRDWNSKTPPCLTSVECLQIGGRLHAIAVLRSHDIFKGGIPNAVGIRHMQKMIADELGFELGQLLIQSGSAHIYESDWDNALKLVKCAFGTYPEKPSVVPDPRGNFIIRTEGGMIKVTLRSQDGIELWAIENRYPDPIMAKILQLGLVTDPSHLMYLGYQIAIAHALNSIDGEYVQD